MKSSGRPKHRREISCLGGLYGWPAHVILTCLALVVLFVQALHPVLHPLEVINPDAKPHLTCPVSHAAGDLLLILPPPAPACLTLWFITQPLPWLGRLDFVHHLAPRPPPTFSL
jgi:hypothetical protein